MKKLILGAALSALAVSGTHAATLFTLECLEFYTASATEDELAGTLMKITGEEVAGGNIKLTFDNTSSLGGNVPIVTAIGVYNAFSYFEDSFTVTNMPNGGLLVMDEGTANDIGGGGVANPGADDAVVTIVNGQGGVARGLNPDDEILMVEFTPKAGVSAATIKTAFESGAIPIHMRFQSYDSGESAKGTAIYCGPNGEIPEPGRALFGLIGLVSAVMIRRRSRVAAN